MACLRAPASKAVRPDGLLVLGLVESMQITKQFRKNKLDFRWTVFIRSDVYEFIVRDMADYGKHAAQTLEWDDDELLKRLLRKRIESSSAVGTQPWEVLWQTISLSTVRGQDTLDFLVRCSLMRPRYLIRMFETAKRRAINMGHQKIQEADYLAALEELGWTVMEDLNLELRDIVNSAGRLLYDIAQLDGACGLPELREAVAKRVGATQVVDKVIDVLLWSAAIGIAPHLEATFIYDCGYKLEFLRSLIDCNPHAEVCLHPTLRHLFAALPAPTTVAA
jgi:hypothetical protein